MRAATEWSWVMTTMVVPSGAVELVEQVQDEPAGPAVEVAGRLIGEHDAGPTHDGSSDGHALALTAGELAGPMIGTMGETHALERLTSQSATLGRG